MKNSKCSSRGVNHLSNEQVESNSVSIVNDIWSRSNHTLLFDEDVCAFLSKVRFISITISEH